MNVMGIMQQIMSNNRVMGNPMIQNAMSISKTLRMRLAKRQTWHDRR